VANWVRDQFAQILELAQGTQPLIKEEAVQLVCLFLPELTAQPDVFHAILLDFPFKEYARATKDVVKHLCALPFAELGRDICQSVCFAFGKLLALSIVERLKHKVQNDDFSEVFASLVAFLGVAIEDFPTDEAGRRRIAAVLTIAVDGNQQAE
jgi:hypothetical protein